VKFANFLTSDVLKLLDARKFHNTPINPRANGQAKNFVKTIKNALSLLMRKSNERATRLEHVYTISTDAP